MLSVYHTAVRMIMVEYSCDQGTCWLLYVTPYCLKGNYYLAGHKNSSSLLWLDFWEHFLLLDSYSLLNKTCSLQTVCLRSNCPPCLKLCVWWILFHPSRSNFHNATSVDHSKDIAYPTFIWLTPPYFIFFASFTKMLPRWH